MKKQCGFLLLYVVVAVLLLPLLLTILCGGLGQELPQEAQVLYGLADLAPLDTELEEYVAGVVAAEMPAAFPEEALKAQAVAARTYQVRQMQAAGSRAVLYDVGQAYLSEAEQKEKWGEGYALYAGKIHSAVRATAGEIMTYDGEPILAAFQQQSGGRTEDAAHVWNTAVPVSEKRGQQGDRQAPNNETTVTIAAKTLAERLGVADDAAVSVKKRTEAAMWRRCRQGARPFPEGRYERDWDLGVRISRLRKMGTAIFLRCMARAWGRHEPIWGILSGGAGKKLS